MNLWEKLFGKWKIIKTKKIDVKLNSLLFGNESITGVLEIKENTKTKKQRAFLHTVNNIEKINIKYAKEFIGE